MTTPFQFVYEFNQERVDGKPEMKDLLGGKGAGLAKMYSIGLPVPAGFTISTRACTLFNQNQKAFQQQVWPEVLEALHRLEKVTGKQFGTPPRPLLLSVRSGARFSMPGMMDTVLNIGLSDRIVNDLLEQNEAADLVYDCYRRLLQMFGDVVLNVPRRSFEIILARRRKEKSVRHDIELEGDELGRICEKFKELIREESGPFPQDPLEQLRLSVEAVFQSWNNPRAVTYRQLNDISEDLGTAINVQMMVFGNRGADSASGVGFTRNPSTGEPDMYGEFLPRSQGEEVVAGIRTPLGLEEMKQTFPEAHHKLKEYAATLETTYREMQDFEFTIETGKLYMLQTRDGKRTGAAAVRIARDMHQEGLISREEAVMRVNPDQLKQLLHPVLQHAGGELLAEGLPASPGASVGQIVFSADQAVNWSRNGKAVVLVRSETTPDDIHGINVAEGILTARGGMTSHAAVVARGMGKCCVVGCEGLRIDEKKKEVQIQGRTLREGDYISVDGNSGKVFLGKLQRVESDLKGGLIREYLGLLGEFQTLKVRANADTATDAQKALEFGAVGIGLCRTEHMFFAEDRLPVMQDMLTAGTAYAKDQSLGKLREFQKEDFLSILEVMDGRPVTVRLLDPPLHEFLPEAGELSSRITELREKGGEETEILRMEKLLKGTAELRESNPMMGHRGCRLGISHPEITRMQSQALFEAACQVKRMGKSPVVEVMIPLVSLVEEFQDQAALIREVAEQVFEDTGIRIPFEVGTMIELPRAALLADQLALHSDFFSFGTNDLTQMTFGFSRDDADDFIKDYRRKNILPSNPFETLDQGGVGQLMRMAVEKGRRARPDLQIGICGEHSGDPASVRFCQELEMDYVSCSPYSVPLARLAAAQAAIGCQPADTR